jgi:flagellin-like hook-associated protein FlgL
VQSLTSALAGLSAITKLVENLKGLLISLQTATTIEASSTVTVQYNSILGQIDQLANDASYQGRNLINNATQNVTVQFANDPAGSSYTISALRNDSAGLGLSTVATNLFFVFTTSITSIESRASRESVASIQSLASLASVAAVAARGSENSAASAESIGSFDSVNSAPGSTTNPDTVPSQASRASVASVASVASRASLAAVTSAPSIGTTPSVAASVSANSIASIPAVPGVTIAGVNTALITARQLTVSNALVKLRSDSATLGSNTAVLNIRLDFSKNYVNALRGGSDRLTLADLNEEGANLTSLQTRQQLGVVSLSISTQSEQSILRLFG